MAIAKFGVLVVGVRGTVGGAKFSANKSGPYISQWSRSANPRTPFQTAQRASIATMPPLWRALTDVERTAWAVFAALPAQERFNSLGESFFASGFNWFTIINVRLLNMGRASRIAPPVQAVPAAPPLTALQLPFSARQSAQINYPAGTFLPDFDQVIEIAIHPSTGLTNTPKQLKLLLLDQNPASFDAGFAVPYLNRINIAGSEYKGFTRVYRQTTDGRRSSASSADFESGDAPPFLPAANDYNGTTNFALRGADLTGNADSKVCTFSCWFRVDGGDGTLRRMLTDSIVATSFFMGTDNKFRFILKDTGFVTIIDARTITTFASGAAWHNVIISVDLAAARVQFVVDGVPETPTITTGPIDATINWTNPNHAVGATIAGAVKWDGCISQLYFNNAKSIDLQANNNFRAFIDLDGNPVFLGGLGTFPTKTAPILFFPDADPSANIGTGGNYVNQAALAACGTTP